MYYIRIGIDNQTNGVSYREQQRYYMFMVGFIGLGFWLVGDGSLGMWVGFGWL